jgi:hypothetical protein
VVNDRLDADPHASERRCPVHDIRVKEEEVGTLFTCSSPRRAAPFPAEVTEIDNSG